MKTMRGKHNRMLHLLLLVGVPLITTLILLIGTIALHRPGALPLSFAHAMTLQATCASTRGTQPDLCNQHNPYAQGCETDAQSVEVVLAFTPQNALIGEVDIRHSLTCNAYWVRTVAYANASQVQAVDATISFNNGKVQVHRNTTAQSGQRLIASTDMTQPTVLPKTLAGVFHLRGQRQPMTIPL